MTAVSLSFGFDSALVKDLGSRQAYVEWLGRVRYAHCHREHAEASKSAQGINNTLGSSQSREPLNSVKQEPLPLKQSLIRAGRRRIHG